MHLQAGTVPASGGVYVLAVRLQRRRRIERMGRVAARVYAPGTYLYVGSARRGLRARIARHLRAQRRRHWHVDRLLDAGRVTGVWWLATDRARECALAETARSLGMPVPWFGASDCRCPSHLVQIGARSPGEAFVALTAAFQARGTVGALLAPATNGRGRVEYSGLRLAGRIAEGNLPMGEAEIGHVSHWYGHLSVAGVTLTAPLSVGDHIHVKGHTTDFETVVESLQIEHETVEQAGAGDRIGVMVPQQVREHDRVYLVSED